MTLYAQHDPDLNFIRTYKSAIYSSSDHDSITTFVRIEPKTEPESFMDMSIGTDNDMLLPASIFIDGLTGNVAIGGNILEPLVKLHVSGDSKIEGEIMNQKMTLLSPVGGGEGEFIEYKIDFIS